MQPHAFEDFVPGQEFATGEHALEAAEIDRFADLSGDRNPLHLDEEYARAAGFPGRIAQGVLGLAIATGLLNRLGLTRGTLIALLGVSWDFRRPLSPGDRVSLRLRVGEVRPSRKAGQGVVRLEGRLCTPDGVAAQEGSLTLLVRCRGAEGGPPDSA